MVVSASSSVSRESGLQCVPWSPQELMRCDLTDGRPKDGIQDFVRLTSFPGICYTSPIHRLWNGSGGYDQIGVSQDFICDGDIGGDADCGCGEVLYSQAGLLV